MAAISNSESTRRLSGIDVLRIGAMVFITAQHALSLTNHEDWTTFRSMNIGQLGVGIFLAISALLASTSRRPPIRWLTQRLGRIYPSYWLTMIGCFTAAWFTHYKQFSFSQVLSQMLGLGLFTHPNNLINVPTWFISLILVCYLGLFLIRLSRRPLPANLIVLVALVAWSASSEIRWPWFHLISFFVSSATVIALPETRRAHGFLAVGISFLLLASWSVAFAYTGLSLLAIGIALEVPTLPSIVTRIADHCYEYYLIHGVALILAISAFYIYPVTAIVCGAILASLGSVVLKRVTAWIAESVRVTLGRIAD